MTDLEKHATAYTDTADRRFASIAALDEPKPSPFVLRLEDVPETPRNLERIRERVLILNRRLAASGTPFRLRVA